MKKNLSLTREQQDEICYLIGEWYLEWKHKILSDHPGQHRLGVAKEQLKDMICNIEKNKCKWKLEIDDEDYSYNSLCGYDFTFLNGNTIEQDCPHCSFKVCPYCGKEIEWV